MAMKLGELEEFFSPGLSLTIRGKEYVVPLASGELGIWCRMMGAIVGELSGDSDVDDIQSVQDRIDALPKLPGGSTLPERMLGDELLAEMLADQIPDPYIQYAAMTAYVQVLGGDEMAERWWNSGGRPEALRPVTNRAQRRAEDRSQPTGKTSTGGATVTRLPGISNGTRSRRTRGRRGRGQNTPGQTSSPGGN